MIDTANQTFVRTVIGTFGMAFCATVCLVAAAGPAAAAPVTAAIPTRVVSYADLDLSSTAGRAALNNRVDQAARAVCSVGNGDLFAQAEEARCIRAAKAAAQVRS